MSHRRRRDSWREFVCNVGSFMSHTHESLHEIQSQLRRVMSNQEKLNQAAATIVTQLDEVKAEIQALKDANPALDFTALDSAVQAVSDVVPDAPVDPPVDPVDPPTDPVEPTP